MTIAQFQKLIEDIYFQKDNSRGMERTFIDLGLSQDGQRLYALDATIALNAYTHNIFVFDTQLNVLIRKIPNEAVNPVRLIVAPAPP